jgi:hypothetical protein
VNPDWFPYLINSLAWSGMGFLAGHYLHWCRHRRPHNGRSHE